MFMPSKDFAYTPLTNPAREKSRDVKILIKMVRLDDANNATMDSGQLAQKFKKGKESIVVPNVVGLDKED